ncbi:unnamed protein product, partial [Rotaria sp. Silwood1]
CNDGNAIDEVGCPYYICNGTNSTKCANSNVYIQRTYLCSGDNDCVDNSDEIEFQCENSRCVPYSW